MEAGRGGVCLWRGRVNMIWIWTRIDLRSTWT